MMSTPTEFVAVCAQCPATAGDDDGACVSRLLKVALCIAGKKGRSLPQAACDSGGGRKAGQSGVNPSSLPKGGGFKVSLRRDPESAKGQRQRQSEVHGGPGGGLGRGTRAG